MSFELLAFYAFAAAAVLSAVAVIGVRNPVHAALWLVLTFFSVACTWLLAGAEFLGVALVLVYVGAVMVLFLFVVMMLDIDLVPLREGYVRYLPVGLAVAVVMLLEILALVGISARMQALPADPALAADLSNTEWIARTLFTRFLLPFEVAALILTVAVIAAVTLTLRRRTGNKSQNPGEQARVRAVDRVRLVSMPSSPRQGGPGDARRPRRSGGRAMSLLGTSLSLGHFLALGAALFCISVAGIFLNRKNVIILLMSIELMLLAVNINFIAFSRHLGDAAGQVFVFFILTVAAAEAAIGLAILVTLFRNRRTINVAEIDTLKG